MAFRVNYAGQRAERQRAARQKAEDKQKKRDEKAARRAAERAGEGDDTPAPSQEQAERD